MKYTARHVRKFLEEGKIDYQLWKMHFPSLLESRVPTCEECDDFKSNLCTGGKEPVECFLAIESCTDQASDDETKKQPGKEKSKKYQWNSKGKEKIIPSGANKAYDQSKL
ncbi:MAG: hypothetical protein WCP36_05070 [Methanomicrobiales archaeon]